MPYDGDEAFQQILSNEYGGPGSAEVPKFQPEATPPAPSTTKVTKVAFKDESDACPQPPATVPKPVPPSASEPVDGSGDPPASPKQGEEDFDAPQPVVHAPGLHETLPSPPEDEGKDVQAPLATPNLLGKDVTWFSFVTILFFFGL